MEQELNNEKESLPKNKFERYMLKPHLIIKDPSIFKIDSAPPKIIDRRESEEFYKQLSVFVGYRKPNNLLIKGYPGSGKTVTINFAMQQLKRIKPDIEIIQIQCYGKSSSNILKFILKNDAPQKSLEIMMKTFLEKLKNDCIIVFDEIDRSDRILYMLYHLSRPKELVPSFNKNINLILISNNLAWEESLPDRIRSSLQLTEIVFPPYGINEIQNIIKQRIRLGFKDPKAISDELINFISQKVLEEKRSDSRLAIEIIFNTALEAESDGEATINLKHINSALKSSIYALDKQMISKLDDHQLLTLCATCLNNISSVEDLYKSYSSLIKDNRLNIKAKGKVMVVHHYLNYLDDVGAIDKRIDVAMTKDNVPRKSLKTKCKIDRQLVLEELSIRGLRLTENYEKQ
ncbi:AAA family ATPase [Candidatus Woesearchaeota archaeon]|nr:AAA family ATPase [Candidatus Woesearchaeota archaeon]